MKKLMLLICLLLISTNVYASPEEVEVNNEKKEVTLVKCTSSQNIWLKIDDKDVRVSLIAYDKEDGNLNKTIDSFICETLKHANKLSVEFEEELSEPDKYNRTQVWLYADETLLQESLIKNGYGQVNYIQGEYKYVSSLCEEQKKAISSSLGIWNYQGIEEVYCKSGIKVGEEIKEEITEEETKEKYDMKSLYLIITLDSGIVLLLLLGRKKDKNEKR